MKKMADPREELREQWSIQFEDAPELDEIRLGRASTQILMGDVAWQNVRQEKHDDADKEHRDDREPKSLQDKPFHISQKCSEITGYRNNQIIKRARAVKPWLF